MYKSSIFRTVGIYNENLMFMSLAKMRTKAKRGRPYRSSFESARAAFWACNLSCLAGKTLAEIEREIYPSRVKKRDGGGYEQPNNFNKYSKGEKAPKSPTTHLDSPVNLADTHYPGSALAYHSIFWQMINNENIEINLNKYRDLISIEVKESLQANDIDIDKKDKLPFSDEEFKKMVAIQHIDVLALMLLQLRHSKEIVKTIHIFYIRNWLSNACYIYEPFKKCKSLMLRLIEEKVYELGILIGISGIDKNKSDIQASRDAFLAALLSGKTVELDHPLDII